MAIKVGVLQVDLVANTASFTQPLSKAADHSKTTAKQIQENFNSMDLGESRGGLLLIDELIGVHIPRHAAAFASQIPGFAAIFATLFPVAAVAAIGVALFDATEKVKKHREEMEKAKTQVLETAVAFARQGDALLISNMRLQDQIAILQRKPATNQIAIAMTESKKAVDELIDSFGKAIDKISELLDKQKQGFWNKLFNGDKGSNDLIEAAQKFKGQIEDLIQERTTAELKGNSKEAADYKAKIDEKVKAYRAFLSTQQDDLDKQKASGIDNVHTRVAHSSVPVPAASVAALEKQVNDAYKDRQQILNDLIILTNSYGERQTAVAEHSGLEQQLKAAESLRKIQDLHDRVGQEIRRMDDATEKHSEELNARATSEYLKEIEKENQATIKANDIIIKVYETQLDAAVQHNNALNALDTQRDNYLRQLGLISESEYEKNLQKRLAATHAESLQELQLKLAAAKTGSVQEAQIQAQIQKLNDKYLSDSEKAEQASLLRRAQQWQRLSNTITSSFSGWISGSATFGQSWNKMWTGMATTAIESLVQVGIQELIGLAIHQAIADKTKLTNAKKAFGSAYAATADIPIIGPVLAPVAGAAAFAAVMAFEKGGIVPEDAYAMVHHEEMVLPAHISNFIMNAAGNSSGDGGGNHFVFAPTVQAMDAAGLDRVLTKHGDVVKKHFHQHIRRMNLG